MGLAEFNLFEQERPHVVTETVGAQCAFESVTRFDSRRQGVVDGFVEFSEHTVGQSLGDLVLLKFGKEK